MRILLVEDESGIASAVSELLAEEGEYRVNVVGSAKEANRRVREGAELIILDWMLPDGSGIDLLKAWRESGISTPVIFLTARADIVDRVLGLEMGANDYMTKPFSPRELLARIRVQRRAIREREGGGNVPISPERLKSGKIEIDLRARRVRFQERDVVLTHLEYELLKTFVENKDRVFSRNELLDLVWGYESFPTTRTVDYHVVQLRQKLAPSYFQTVHRVGYRFVSGEAE